MRDQLGYADALKLLGSDDSKALDVIGGLLGGVIVGSTVVTGQLGLLELLGARDELVKQSKKLLSKLGQRVRGASGEGRTKLLVAAHAVVAINAYFMTLRYSKPVIDFTRLELSRAEQLALASAQSQERERSLVEQLINASVPLPTPQRPYELTVADMKQWYGQVSGRLLIFVKGLSVWDTLDETKRSKYAELLLGEIPERASRRYEDDFRRLAVDCPEFAMWIYLTDSASSRAMIEKFGTSLNAGFAGLRLFMESREPANRSYAWPEDLARAYQALLNTPIADTSEGEAQLTVPSLGAAYLNPRFRVAEYHDGVRPAEERWWASVAVHDDVQWFLSGYLTSPAATEVPLVILGQPGAGKSLLTKVLAASLPPATYLPVRVELRHVAADASLQIQIEQALHNATREQMRWADLVRAAGDALPLVMLDGFDELLQATGVSQADFLERVQDFQAVEAANGRRVAVIVTSRTVVADRMRFPEGTAMVKLEPFNDAQMERWLTIWNDANAEYFQRANLEPLSLSAVIANRDLAEQPLLLLMLSFYDAEGNALQQHSDKLGRADLYDRLLTKFVDREVRKLYLRLDQAARNDQVAKSLQQLSVVAFAMFNRGRKTVAENQLNDDLSKLLPQDYSSQVTTDRFNVPLTAAQLEVGRFFFIHESRAEVGSVRKNEYEFLHATFGEYLVARLVSQALDRMIKVDAADNTGLGLGSPTRLIDEDLWTLLSFTPLTDGSQTAGFLAELITQLDNTQLTGLRRILAALFRTSLSLDPPAEFGRWLGGISGRLI